MGGIDRPSGSLKQNKYGFLYDVTGNVIEWCQDSFRNDMPVKMLRGGGWISDIDGYGLQVANRAEGDFPEARENYHGFRCIVDVK